MANNYISHGGVISLTAAASYASGNPYRIDGFNGVALIDANAGDQLSFQLEGIFEFELEGTSAGDPIYIDSNNALKLTASGNDLYGRAVTSSDSNGMFYCRLLQG